MKVAEEINDVARERCETVPEDLEKVVLLLCSVFLSPDG